MNSKSLLFLAYTLMCVAGGMSLALLLLTETAMTLEHIYEFVLFLLLPSLGYGIGFYAVNKDAHKRVKRATKPKC